MVIELAVLAAALAVIGLIAAYALSLGVAPAATSPRVRSVMLKAVPDDLDGAIFELGSGWGTLAFALARRFPRSPVWAFELSPVPWLFSRVRGLLAPAPNLSIRRADLHGVPLAEARLVVCYLSPGAMADLAPRLQAELRPGAWVLSNTFAVPGWRPAAVLTADDVYRTRVYLYRAPGN